MRVDFPRIGLTLLATAVVGGTSWLLLADPSQGRPAQRLPRMGTSRVRPAAATAAGYGYGGYGFHCRQATLTALFPTDALIKGGRMRVVASNGNPTGDNADLSTDAFLADLTHGTLVNMTKDVKRCEDGAHAGEPCTTPDECGANECRDNMLNGGSADARGKAAYFVFNGNPTGQNPDLGCELFAFDPQAGTLTQATHATGWCSDDVATPCQRSSDCGTLGGGCARAAMSDVQVSSDGRRVSFVSDADLGGNPGHGKALYVLTAQGRDRGAVRIVGGGGKFCDLRTANRGQACTNERDCGAICGDGRVEAPEQCEFGGCPAGQFCAFPGSTHQCTCQTPQCGDGIIQGNEECDPTCFRGPAFTCVNCRCVPLTCGNGQRDPFEQCDPTADPPGCGFGVACSATCTCTAGGSASPAFL